jgi:dimeric dUTPase (all-alpha-NTP-PPase superfamily)
MELLNNLLQMVNVDPALFAKIMPIVVLSLGILSGVYMILDAISKFTKSDADNKIVAYFGKVIDLGKKLVDFFSGNQKH